MLYAPLVGDCGIRVVKGFIVCKLRYDIIHISKKIDYETSL